MCGIAVIFRNTGLLPDDEARLHRMTEALHHRGPDSTGFVTSENVMMGVRRLRVLDLSTGDQPIYNENKSVAVILNGEIYNYRDLGQDLQSQGHIFSTKSDTETIVHGYEQWAEDSISRLRGMFAFAVLDQRPATPRLLLVRDRMGIKPLYYYKSDAFTLFASEVRALLASGLVPRKPSQAGIYSYLSFGSVQEPLSLVQGIHSVPPGHFVSIHLQTGDAQTHRYWSFPTIARKMTKRSNSDVGFRQAVEGLQPLLKKAVSLRMIADVPLGAFLSGGIDSGAVVALMAQEAASPVNAFTIGFGETEFNEAPLAHLAANRAGVDQTTITLTPQQVLDELPETLRVMDQPSIDGVNTYYVSKAARRAGMTVALSGLGGDELFAGYRTFRDVPSLRYAQKIVDRLPHFARLGSATLWTSTFGPFVRSTVRNKARAFLAGDMLLKHPYFLTRALFTPRQVERFFTSSSNHLQDDGGLWINRVKETIGCAESYDEVTAVSYLECNHYLLSTLLRDTDQMSMAHSLEVRVPLIDHELVEYVMKIEGEYKLSRTDMTPKRLLVRALAGGLPPETVYRPKTPFAFPWEPWLRGPLRHEVQDTLRSSHSILATELDNKLVSKTWEDFLKGNTSWSRPWSLYVLEKWLAKNLE